MTEPNHTNRATGAGQAYVERLDAAASAIKEHFQTIPDTLIIAGSGLEALTAAVARRGVLSYSRIPHMPQVSTEGHAGNLIVGTLNKKEVAIFQGRVHCHDGLPVSEVVFGVRTMVSLGVKNLIVTNAAGSMRERMRVGDLVVLDNHVTLFLPEDPAFGLEHPRLGEKFYPQTDPYDRALGDMFMEVAASIGCADRCHRGVYCFRPGPRYESRADIAFLRSQGIADVVGMSTVPEVLAGLQMSRGALRVLGVTTVTNFAAGLSNQEPNHGEVMIEGAKAAPKLGEILTEIVGRL